MFNYIEKEDRERYYRLLDQVFDSGFLSEGKMVKRFEEEFGAYVNLPAVALSNGGTALSAILEYIDVKDHDVVVPTNTFMATPLAVTRAGGNVVFADCNKEDLCLGLENLKQVVTPSTKAVIVVHIGGHIAFDIFQIAQYCKEKNIYLIEDCAHAHGATFKGRAAGSFGVAGAYSFYATKTMPLGEGGMVVSSDSQFIEWCKLYRNYGKFDYKVEGFNYRMNEVTAAFGCIQLERLPRMLAWKRELAQKFDQIFPQRVMFPSDMVSGYYKYIAFNTPLAKGTGKVYDLLCHDIMKRDGDFTNSQWLKDSHYCPPIYYKWEHYDKPPEELAKILLP